MARKVRWYIGIPECGKTTLAVEFLARDVNRTGYPALVIDSMHAKNFRDKPHAQTVAEAVRTVWRDGRHCWFWPRDRVQLDALMRAALDGWRCHILIDEAHIWMNERYLPDSVSALMRGAQHWDGTMHLTTQFYGDVSREARGMSPAFEIFKCAEEDEETLKRLERETGFPADQIKSLPLYSHLTKDAK